MSSRAGRGKRRRASRLGRRAMRDLVVAHRLDDRAAARIVGRQARQMLIEMTFDLSLGLGDEARG